MHGDAHPGNVYFRNGEAGLLDWQAVRRGHPGRELAYTLVTSMTTTDRQTHQRDCSTITGKSWQAQAARTWIATSCGTAIARARSTPTSPR